MQISIRSATQEDVPSIMRICLDPQVTPNQYRVSAKAEPGFRAIVAGEVVLGRYERRITIIEVNGEIAGYIHHDHSFFRGAEAVAFGWNLAPVHWGKGIMPVSVKQLMDQCVSERKTQLFIVECFRDNQRCLRVIDKLGFREAPISLYERAVTALAQRCRKWVLRFEIDLRQNGVANPHPPISRP
jgi:RimJ/RimL family protein N-acetyltransferase